MALSRDSARALPESTLRQVPMRSPAQIPHDSISTSYTSHFRCVTDTFERPHESHSEPPPSPLPPPPPNSFQPQSTERGRGGVGTGAYSLFQFQVQILAARFAVSAARAQATSTVQAYSMITGTVSRIKDLSIAPVSKTDSRPVGSIGRVAHISSHLLDAR